MPVDDRIVITLNKNGGPIATRLYQGTEVSLPNCTQAELCTHAQCLELDPGDHRPNIAGCPIPSVFYHLVQAYRLGHSDPPEQNDEPSAYAGTIPDSLIFN
jgi:hypothetical protein